jgi:molecular chaperone GrpE
MDDQRHDNDIPVPQPNGQSDELDRCKRECDEYLAGWQRAKADFANYKKDEAKRMEEVARYANEELLYEMVNILDNFDLGLQAMEKTGQVEKGVYMIRTQIEDTLRRHGLYRIPIAIGDPFDPSVAEAIAEGDPPAGGGAPPGSVLEEIEPGYRLYDKVIRPARVRIAKGKEHMANSN